jgi:RNA polymerase sigma factor (sigma-70 family)
MKDLLIQFKFKNNILEKALRAKMEEYGCETISDFARKVFDRNHKIKCSYLSSYGTLRKNPRNKNTGKFKDSAIEVSKVLGVPCEELFPAGLYAYASLGQSLPQIELETESDKYIGLDSPEVLALDSGFDTQKQTIQREYREGFEKLFLNLSSREQQIIKFRFGFDDGIPRTLEETARIFNVTREGIRQYEEKILEKLRYLPITKKIFSEKF